MPNPAKITMIIIRAENAILSVTIHKAPESVTKLTRLVIRHLTDNLSDKLLSNLLMYPDIDTG